jgi:hypothetical protein
VNPPGGYPNAARRLVENAILHSLQQADPGLERRDEVDLAIHRASRDFRDLRPKAQKIGQLV